MNRLLAGTRVVELATTLMGPYCSFQLAELGADVIKIEEPNGDLIRRIGPGRDAQMGPIFVNSNRGKRSVVLDLKSPAAADVLHRLVRAADVFVHNLRPRAAERLGVSADALRAVNPRLIHCSLTGFGTNGRYRDLAAYDDVIQAASGLAAAQGGADAPPTYVRATVADKVVATVAVGAIAAAMFGRERTGDGATIEVPMLETMVGFNLMEMQGGRVFRPATGPTGYPRVTSPFRRPYRTRDGFLSVVVYTDRQWKTFFELIGRPDLSGDRRFATIGARTEHVDELYELLEQHLAERTSAEWLERLQQFEIPSLPVHTLESVFDDPHLVDVGLFREVDHPSEGRLTVARRAVRVDGEDDDPALHRPAPRLGEHTIEVLREHGFDTAEISALVAAGAVPAFGDDPSGSPAGLDAPPPQPAVEG